MSIEMEKIAKKIQKIEDTDPNYVLNERWQQLREIQNRGFCAMAKKQMKELQHRLTDITDEKRIAGINAKLEDLQNLINKIEGDKNEKF